MGATSAISGLSHTTLRTVEDVRAHAADWDRIVEQDYEANPFLSTTWHLTWLEHFAAGDSVRYVRVTDGDRAVGFFPMVLRRDRFHGIPITALDFACNMYSPVCGPVVRRDAAATVWRYFVERVLGESPWLLLRGREMPAELVGLDDLRTALHAAGYRTRVDDGAGNWIYDGAAATSDEYFKALKYNLRSDTKRFPKKLEELGKLTFRLVSGDLSDTDVAAYREVYGRSWKEPEFDPTFHPHLMKVAAAAGWLRLGFLFLDERPIAAQLWVLRGGRGYVMKTAYDEAFGKFSPGTILTWRVIQRLMDAEQMRSFDYLKGDDAYKKYWTTRRRQRQNLVVFQKGLRGAMLEWLDRKALPAVRRVEWLNRAKNRAKGLLAPAPASAAKA